MAPTRATITLIDYSGETTKTGFYLPEMDEHGDNYDDIIGRLFAVQTAVVDASDCEHVSTTFIVPYSRGMYGPPAIVTAQREIALRIKYRDTITGDIEYATVPGPIEAFYPPQGIKGDYVPLDNVVFAPYIAAIEANIVSKRGNTITVLEGRLVGRNS